MSDAVLTAGAVASLPRLSWLSAHRRGWGSVSDALAAGLFDVDALRVTLCATLAQPPTPDHPVVSAVDLSIWPRSDAEASPERGDDDPPSRHSAGHPIVAGWA